MTVRIAETVGAAPAAVSDKPGRFMVQLIDAGEGSSGFYPEDMLRQAAVDRVFASGTHMYMDHAAAHARGVNGERSIRDLAAVLVEDARYNDQTSALEAEAMVLPMYASVLKELVPHTGVSISAFAEVGPPPYDGGPQTITRLLEAESVDFVTHAGRGGKVLAILESAKLSETTTDDMRDKLNRVVRAANPDVWAWVSDYDPDKMVVYYDVDGTLYAQEYETSSDTDVVLLVGDRTEVRAVTQYVPANLDGTNQEEKGAEVPEIAQERLDALLEAEQRLAVVEGENAALAEQVATLEADKAAAQRANTIRAAVDTACEGKPAALRDRVEAAVKLSDTDDIAAAVEAAVEAEQNYLAALAADRIEGFGTSRTAESEPKRKLWN